MPNEPDIPTTESEIKTLCERASEGDHTALERLLWLYHTRFLGFATRKIGVDWNGKIETDDLIQDSYLQVFNDIKGFSYQGPDSFIRWVMCIIENRFIDQMRRWRRKKRDISREVSQPARSNSGRVLLLERCLADSTTASRLMRREDALGAMTTCIAQLPKHYRLIISRIYLEERPVAEVAGELERSEDAVRRMCGRAIEKLSECLGRASRYLSDVH